MPVGAPVREVPKPVKPRPQCGCQTPARATMMDKGIAIRNKGEGPMSQSEKYWFPAKRYGWGWGFPVTWQGWVTLAVYAALLCLVIIKFEPHGHPVAFAVLVAVLTLALSVVCWLKGEPPRWRWGKDRR
jgi:hypothetical protein